MSYPSFPTVAATGHRKLTRAKRAWVRKTLAEDVIPKLRDRHGTQQIVSGMAMLFDLDWAEEGVDGELRLRPAIPFPNQTATWEDEDEVLRRAALLENVPEPLKKPITPINPGNPRQAANLLHKRNRWMVDRAAALVACWDRKRSDRSGTFQTLLYASRRLPNRIIWLDIQQQRVVVPTPYRWGELLVSPGDNDAVPNRTTPAS